MFKPRIHVIYADRDNIYLDNIKVINRRDAMLQFSICSVLMDHYFDEAKNGANFITPEKIAKRLHKDLTISDVSVAKINNAIYKIRNIFKKKFNISEPIIISKKWKGYRIDENVFLGRKTSRGENNFE